VIAFEQLAAALYLAAGLAALLGLSLPSGRILRGSRWGLALGALAQALALATLHRLDPAPRLTDLSQAIAFTTWVGVIFFLGLSTRYRLPGFVPPLGLVAFLAAFGTTLRSDQPVAGRHYPQLSAAAEATGSLPHAHVLLASAGLAALGLAGLAGFFFLLEHRALKRRRSLRRRIPLPSLEALDRVNRTALVLGFPLLTIGVVTGALWLEVRAGRFWSGTLHETWTAIAWVIYLGLVGLRFMGHQGARQAAASAVAGFAFLLFAVVGVGLVS
jgi:ABC-type transport system involved in cytochrome c biogenesis permease subunit